MATHLSFRQGVQECIPTLLGYAGVGISFGIVASSQNFSILEIILFNLFILWTRLSESGDSAK